MNNWNLWHIPARWTPSQPRRGYLSAKLVTTALMFSALSVMAAQPYFRLQSKGNNQFLDADHCGSRVAMNPGSDWEGGACQLWRLVPADNEWYRLQLKHGGQYLDADHCSDKLGMNPGSDWENGACQLWRLVPTEDGWNRLQLKHGGKFLDVTGCGREVAMYPYTESNDGSCQLWKRVYPAIPID